MASASPNDREAAADWLEQLQARVYAGLGIEPEQQAEFDEAELRRILKQTHLRDVTANLNLSEDEYVELLVDNRRRILAQLPTRFEDPDYYMLISGIAEDIEKTLQDNGRTLPLNPLFGTLPTGRVNGFAAAVPNSQYRVIMLEDGMFGFANLMCKAVAMSFPEIESEKEGGLRFSTDPDDVKKMLRDKPEIARRFLDAVSAYLVHGHPHHAQPYAAPRGAMYVGSILRDSMETFVVGHEYGHVVAGHLGAATSRCAMVADVDVETISTDWMQEFEADALGLESMLGVRQAAGYDLAMSFWGADAFFGCIDVVERAISILEYGEERPWVADTHPPTKERRRFQREMIKLSLPNEPAVDRALDLAAHLETAIDSLWAMVRPAFLAMHRDGLRPTAGWRAVA